MLHDLSVAKGLIIFDHSDNYSDYGISKQDKDKG